MLLKEAAETNFASDNSDHNVNESKEKQDKALKSVTISNEKTQNTEMIQNNSEEYKTPPKKSLVMSKRSKK